MKKETKKVDKTKKKVMYSWLLGEQGLSDDFTLTELGGLESFSNEADVTEHAEEYGEEGVSIVKVTVEIIKTSSTPKREWKKV